MGAPNRMECQFLHNVALRQVKSPTPTQDIAVLHAVSGLFTMKTQGISACRILILLASLSSEINVIKQITQLKLHPHK